MFNFSKDTEIKDRIFSGHLTVLTMYCQLLSFYKMCLLSCQKVLSLRGKIFASRTSIFVPEVRNRFDESNPISHVGSSSFHSRSCSDFIGLPNRIDGSC